MSRVLMTLVCMWIGVGMGVGLGARAEVDAAGVLIRVDDPWRYRALTGDPPSGWEMPGFDDSGWEVGAAGFSVGYTGYQQGATVLPGTLGGATVRGIAVRREWVLPDPSGVRTLSLRLDHEDGVIVWLNGEEVTRWGLASDGRPGWDAVAASRPAGESVVFDLTPWLPRLRPGTNVLALQVFEASTLGSSLFLWPELRANFIRGPLLQNVGTNAVTVVWRCPGPTPARVEIRGVGAGGDAAGGVWRVVRPGAVEAGQAVVVDGLEEGTAYQYRVVLEDALREWVSEPGTFRTLRSAGDLEFIAVGDTGASTPGHYAVARMLESEAVSGRVDLALHTGDIVYPGFTVGRVDLRCFGVHERSLRSLPWFFTFGNHDVYQGEQGYLDSFVLPRNAATGGSQFYSFDHGDAHFVSLFVPWWGLSQIGAIGPDGSRSAQYHWLTNDLASTSKPWKIVFFHQPLRTSGPHITDDYNVDGLRDVPQMQEHLLPLLASLGVQLVLNGHDHNWERFAPTRGLHTVVTGGGGAFLYSEYQRDPVSARFVSRHHHARVRIRGRDMEVEAVGVGGEVFDRFSIRRPGAAAEAGEAPWRDAVPGVEGVDNLDGNRLGERFDLTDPGWPAVSGGDANLGRLVVAVDMEGVHLGLRDLMLWPGQTVGVLVGAAGVSGVPDLAQVGVVTAHPLGRLRLRFGEAFPSLVALLGDERVDGNEPGFLRPGATVPLGQGVFRLDAGLTPVPGARLRQFNQSPEVGPDPLEQNANFVRVTLPWGALPGVLPGGRLRVAILAWNPVAGTAGEPYTVDASHFARALGRDPDGAVHVEAVEVALAAEPRGDSDLDGLSWDEEVRLGTDPTNPDTDADGLPDGWEVRHGLDPVSGVGSAGADGDPDGDGYTNLEEYRSGMDPGDAASTLVLRGTVERVGLEVRARMRWRAVPGRTYGIEVSSGVGGGFSEFAAVGFPRVAGSTNETVLLPVSGVTGWYRVVERR